MILARENLVIRNGEKFGSRLAWRLFDPGVIEDSDAHRNLALRAIFSFIP